MLGQGGGGISYLAFDRQLEREVVIKEHFPQDLCRRFPGSAEVQPTDAAGYARSLHHFCREARILAGLNHPGIVKVYDIFQASDTAYMVMEYVEGESLATWLAAHAGNARMVQGVLVNLLAALEYAHGCEVFHRDVKPSNIVVRGDDFPVLIDFGVARLGLPETTTLTLVGSPGYAPPEQYLPHGNIGPWSDLYALAYCFLACIPADLLKRYPKRFVQSLHRAANPDIALRFSSAAAWRAQLRPTRHLQYAAWGVLGLCMLAGAAVLGGWLMQGVSEPPPPASTAPEPVAEPKVQAEDKWPVEDKAHVSEPPHPASTAPEPVAEPKVQAEDKWPMEDKTLVSEAFARRAMALKLSSYKRELTAEGEAVYNFIGTLLLPDEELPPGIRAELAQFDEKLGPRFVAARKEYVKWRMELNRAPSSHQSTSMAESQAQIVENTVVRLLQSIIENQERL